MTMLRPGSTGPRVRALEERLDDLGYLEGGVDNTFDQATGDAVLAYKKDHGWEDPKGVAGARLSQSLKMGDAFASHPSRPKALKGATYNCRIGRPPHEVAKVVSQFAHGRKLDFMQLQEISGYHRELQKIPGYHLITFPGSKDHGETGVLVRDGIETRRPQSIEAATGWTNVHGRPAQPRASTSVQLAGWLRVTSVHAPPGIDFVNGHAVGPKARVKSYLSLMKRLAANALRHEKNNPNVALLTGGDWNEGATSTGVGSPRWLARESHMKTSPDGRIDWEMAHGAKVSKVRVGPSGGSDHRLVTFTVTQT